MVGGVVVVAIIAGLAFLVYRSADRKRTAAIVGVCVVWTLGVGVALAQFFPGVGQRIPVPVTLEGQRNVREVTLDQAKKVAAFPVFAPTHLPGRLKLESLRVHHAGRSTGVIVIQTYYDDRSNTQVEIWQSAANGFAVTPGQANQKIMGQDALVTVSARTTSVEWSVGTTRLEMTGDYGRREMVKVAQSMR